ncbi:MarR family winged helix-turn-helix transcriptional regulator [Nocardia sp. CDC160]|uniref:MarR family winged helix-turn-helix transcriptional regulator n=1 Tax=Nocardia sp. CDC160 TaxID=3112166 RepID=UPI002DBFED2B|nr:MarR family transcriptional regulator [Nocardia sp. CDC160]MEC3917745.1 MarR family transcriptional regulator [Nocardia sp. CDC160]
MAEEQALENQLCFALYAASRAMTAMYRPKLDSLGITYPQYLVLLALWQRDGRTVGDLCAALELDSGTLSPLLKRLESAGFVERRRSTADERRVEITLTDRGRELRSAACHIPGQSEEITGMSLDELSDLRTTLRRLTEALTSHTRQKENDR